MAGVRSLQQLRHVLDKMRYQRLTEDREDQATGGLDVAMADALASLGSHTRLQETQAWLRQEVTAAVFQALYDQQHPANCSSARKLYCTLKKDCGFGCQLHHAVHCFTIAVATNRTLILQVAETLYVKSTSTWTDTLQPISGCGEPRPDFWKMPSFDISHPTKNADDQELFANFIDRGVLPWDPPAMPQDVRQVVQLFSSRPEIWWVGALISYLIRPSDASRQRHAAFKAANNWGGLTVGVHIRRGDKVGDEAVEPEPQTPPEAKLHDVIEYMAHVERLCDLQLPSGWQQRALRLESADHKSWQQQVQRIARTAAKAAGARPAEVVAAAAASSTAAAGSGSRGQQRSECSVFLASDEPAVVAEIRQKYKHIHVIVNNQGLETGSGIARHTTKGFLGIYDDIMYLSYCDVIVGTFSSQVSRTAYEVSMVNNTLGAPDRTFAYHSLDSMWYFGGMTWFTRCAATDFTDQGKVVVKAGQRLMCAAVHEFDRSTGYERCELYDDSDVTTVLKLPPGLVVDCSAGEGDYRPILPAYMRPPPAAGAGAGAGNAAVVAPGSLATRPTGAAPAASKVFEE